MAIAAIEGEVMGEILAEKGVSVPLVDPVVKHSVGLVMLKEVVATPWGQQLDALFRSPGVEARFRQFSHIAARDRPQDTESGRQGG